MDGIPRRILEVISDLSPAERQWIGIRGIAARVPCPPSRAHRNLYQLEADGYLVIERRGNHPIGITPTTKADDYLASIGSPILTGQIADLA